jgi:hypothetical protein
MQLACLRSSLLLIALSSTSFAQKPSPDWQDIYARVRPSIPFIFSNGGLCSGALISPTLILTAKHCVENVRPVWVSWVERPAAWESASLVHLDEDLDFAILELKRPSTKTPLVLRPSGALAVGETAATVGHPTSGASGKNPPFDLERTHVFSAGHVSQFTGDEVIVDFSISPGNSGGPVLDSEGRVIGVVSRKLIQQFVGHIGYAVSQEPVHRALARIARGDARVPSAWDAPHGFGLAVQFNWDRYQKTLPGARSSYRTGFDFRYTMADRWVLNYSNSFGLNGMKFQSYGLGHRFYGESRNKVPGTLTLSLEALEYEPKDVRTRNYFAHAYHAALGSPVSPLSLRFSWIRAAGSSYFGFGLILGD